MIRKGYVDQVTLEKRFWLKVDKKGDDECWNWKASKDSYGYGKIRYNGKMMKTNRVAYILAHESIPEELDVLHTCDNPSCVNPNHLFLGTNVDNINDKKNKGRAKKEMTLLDDEMDTILKLFYQGLTKSQIADKLGYDKIKVDSAFVSGKGNIEHRKGIRYRSIHRKGFSHKKKNNSI